MHFIKPPPHYKLTNLFFFATKMFFQKDLLQKYLRTIIIDELTFCNVLKRYFVSLINLIMWFQNGIGCTKIPHLSEVQYRKKCIGIGRCNKVLIFDDIGILGPNFEIVFLNRFLEIPNITKFVFCIEV